MSDIRVKTPFGWKDVLGTDEGKLIVVGSHNIIIRRRQIAAAGAYAAEDILSNSATDGQGTPWVFDGVGGSGKIFSAQAFIQTTALTPRLTLYLFSRIPTSELDDNAVNVAPAMASLSFYIGKIDYLVMEDLGGVSEVLVTPNTYGNLPVPYWGCNGKLYGILVTRDAVTATANDFVELRLEVEIYS